jgi:hypothetical protein
MVNKERSNIVQKSLKSKGKMILTFKLDLHIEVLSSVLQSLEVVLLFLVERFLLSKVKRSFHSAGGLIIPETLCLRCSIT